MDDSPLSGMIFLVDEDSEYAAAPLSRMGFVVHRVKLVLGEATADEVVCDHAEEMGAVVVTRNQGHFVRLLDRRQEKPRRYRRAGALYLQCRVNYAVPRLELFADLWQLEWKLSTAQTDARVLIEIRDERFIVHR